MSNPKERTGDKLLGDREQASLESRFYECTGRGGGGRGGGTL